MLKAICLTAWNRPALLEASLASIARLRHLEHWSLFVQLEPSDRLPEVLQLLRSAHLPCSIQLQLNPQRLGVRANPLACLERAHVAGAELLLLLEDDLQLAADALEFVEACAEHPAFASRFSCGNLHFSSCFNQAHLSSWNQADPALPSVALETQYLSSLGLFVLRRQFENFVRPHWWTHPLKLRDHFGQQVAGWDCALNQAILLANRRCLQSLLPRVIHCGVAGVHSDAVLHQRSYAHAGLYAGEAELDSIQIQSVDGINQDPAGTEEWGCLFRLAGQLWTLQRTSLERELGLAEAVAGLKPQLLVCPKARTAQGSMAVDPTGERDRPPLGPAP
jgi:hypothetical protein